MVDFCITRIVEQPRNRVYTLVADVAGYPEFVPGFADAQVRRIGENKLEVLQKVGFKGLSASFRSKAELRPPEGISIRSHDWPFRHLHQEWALEETRDGKTKVTFSGSYTLRSRRLERWFGRWFDDVVRRTVDAFERRLAQPSATP